VVAGIGLNLNQERQAFTDGGLPEAGSLRLFRGQEYDTAAMARQLIQTLDHNYQAILDEGWHGLESDWKTALGLVGQIVVVEESDRRRSGTLLDIGLDGVVLEGEDGYPQIITPEKIRHLRPVVSRQWTP
jgi:biotin-(acetyl-CoA carboxylase) ligase